MVTDIIGRVIVGVAAIVIGISIDSALKSS